MAVTINTYFSERIIEGSRPSVPSVPSSEVPPVVNPPGYPSGHSPVTLASPSNGLTLVGQELGLGLASSGVTGALSGTKFDEFDAKIGGSIASGQVAFGTGANEIGGDSGLVWDNVNKRLGVGSVSPTQSIDTSGNIRVGGNFVYGDTNTPFIRLSNAVGAVIGYGNLTLINGGNAIILTNSSIQYFRINSSGSTLIGASGNPTNTLDVNGTARIRTINNLGTSATVVLTKSATGVISERTLGEFVSDVTPDFDSRYIRKDVADTKSRRLNINGSASDSIVLNITSPLTNSLELLALTNGSSVKVLSVTADTITRINSNTNTGLGAFRITNNSTGSIMTGANSGGEVFRVNNGGGITCNGLSLNESRNITFGTTTGTKIGTSNTQKLAFWNATPIVQPLETALANAPNTGDANTDALITALKNIIINTGLGRSS